jgi:DNA-binding LytR/AlgR family response regulator
MHYFEVEKPKHNLASEATPKEWLNKYKPAAAIKTKLIVKQGTVFIPLSIDKIAAIYANSGINMVIDFESNKYVISESLSELEKILSPKLFFRINRKMIINVDAIKNYKHIEFGKVFILLKPFIGTKAEIIVSQITAPMFKAWVSSL